MLNDIGKLLDPAVICNGQLKSAGADHPDFGLYSSKQCSNAAPKPGQGEIPERGVIEVKPLGDNSWQTSQSKQATKYFDHYRLVLITNYRKFRLVGEDEAGKLSGVPRHGSCLAQTLITNTTRRDGRA